MKYEKYLSPEYTKTRQPVDVNNNGKPLHEGIGGQCAERGEPLIRLRRML